MVINKTMNKLLLPITILISSIILGGFYYAGQLNKQNLNNTNNEAGINFECFKKGEYFFENEPNFQRFKEEFSTKNTSWGIPEYNFNDKLKTCLMSWEATTNIGGVEFKRGGVIDVISNKTILKSDSNPMNYDSYVLTKNALMSE